MYKPYNRSLRIQELNLTKQCLSTFLLCGNDNTSTRSENILQSAEATFLKQIRGKTRAGRIKNPGTRGDLSKYTAQMRGSKIKNGIGNNTERKGTNGKRNKCYRTKTRTTVEREY